MNSPLTLQIPFCFSSYLFSISISTISLSFSRCGGFMNPATPPGVPVMITVPFLNVFPRVKCHDSYDIKNQIIGTCILSRLAVDEGLERQTTSAIMRCMGFKIVGPTGANLSKDFAEPCCFPDRSGTCQNRGDTSFPAV